MAQTAETMEAGPEMDACLAEIMEPRATLPRWTLDEARRIAWGAVAEKWLWYSVDYVESPDGWWRAGIGTDAGPNEASDHNPCRWQPAREPSTDIAAAWLVVRKMREQANARFRSLTLVEWCYNRTYATFNADAFAEYAAATWAEANGEHCTPLAICRAALLAMESLSTPTGAPHDAR